MKSHELARLLLKNENLPIATHANNHTNKSEHGGSCSIGLMENEFARYIIIGNIGRGQINSDGSFIKIIQEVNEWIQWKK